MTLNDLLTTCFEELSVPVKNRKLINAYLFTLGEDHEPTRDHCIRVGYFSLAIGKYEEKRKEEEYKKRNEEERRLKPLIKYNLRPLFYAGSLHDIGKLSVDVDLLNKTDHFNDSDSREMRLHAWQSFKIIKGKSDIEMNVAAEIAYRHHHWQAFNPYPKRNPSLTIKIPEDFQLAGFISSSLDEGRNATSGEVNLGLFGLINDFSKIVALADFHDAILSRRNGRFGNGDGKMTPDMARLKMHENYPKQVELIDSLYKAGIFGNGLMES